MVRTFTTTPGASFSLCFGPDAAVHRFEADEKGTVTIEDGPLADAFEGIFVVPGSHPVTNQPQEATKRGKK
jgi:hypothetical protein